MESPAHCGWGHPCYGGPRFYKKAAWASHKEQASRQRSSMASATAAAPSSCSDWVLFLTSFNDKQWCGSVNQINSFLLNLLLILLFYHSNSDPKTDTMSSRHGKLLVGGKISRFPILSLQEGKFPVDVLIFFSLSETYFSLLNYRTIR